MNRFLFQRMLFPAAAAVLLACGGSGGSVGTSSSLTISGTAAVGAPLAGAKVKVYDSTGTLVADNGTVQPNGSYTITIPAGKSAPFVFVVDDSDQQYVSILNDISQTTVNITPLSHLLAAILSSSGNPQNLISEIAARTTQISTTDLAAKIASLRTLLAPVLTAAGVSANSFDPVATTFAANGTGIDKVLDVLEIAITPSATAANVELTVKTSLNEDDTNPANVLKIQTGGGALPQGTLPAVAASDLPPDGTNLLIQQLLEKLTACYAVPLANRITSGGVTATDITAQECKEPFIDGNPSLYLSNGTKVRKDGHFAGIFTATVPVIFERPKYFGAVRTSQPNGPQAGDMLIGYRWKDDYGNFQYERIMVRKTSSTPAKLEIVGNGYLYESAVTPYAQLRQFIQDKDRDYYSVGYSPYVARRLYEYNSGGATRQKYVSKVTVTTPTNRTILLCNRSGFSFLVMAKQVASPNCNSDSDKTGTSFIRLRSEYLNKLTDAKNHPRFKDTSLAFVPQDWTDSELEEVKTYAAWKFDYEFKDTITNNLVDTATQWHRPPRRVHSIREFKKITLPAVTDDMLTSMKAAVSPLNTNGLGAILIPADGVQVSWRRAYEVTNGSVPEDAVPMTAIRIFGRYRDSTNPNNIATADFEDRMTVRASRTQATIQCPSLSEIQCENVGGITKYKNSSTLRSGYSGLDLWSRGPDGVEYVNFYATYMIPQ